MGKDREKKRKRSSKTSDGSKHRKKRKYEKTEEEEMQWVEAPVISTDEPSSVPQTLDDNKSDTITQTTIDQSTHSKRIREEWMLNSEADKIVHQEPKARKPDPNAYKPVELNTNISGGTPKKEDNRPMLVGDGGKSWREKAKRRAAERELEEQKKQIVLPAASKHSSQYTPTDREISNYNKSVLNSVSSYTKEELELPKNRIKALAMKAKLKGNMGEYERLQSLWEKTEEEIHVLSGLDNRGNKMITSRVSAPSKSHFSTTGDRESFFSDDNRSLKQLVEEEKLGNYSNQTLAQNIIRNSKYKEPDISKDEEYEPKLYEKNLKSAKQTEEEFHDALRKKQIKADDQYNRLIEDCQYCFCK